MGPMTIRYKSAALFSIHCGILLPRSQREYDACPHLWL